MGLFDFSMQKNVSKRSGKGLLDSSLLAMGALVLAGQAGAATEPAPIETAPDGFKAADTIKNFEDAKVLADGSVELTLSSGETVTFAAGDVSVVGGQIFVAETAVVAAGLTFTGAGLSTAAILGAGAAAIAGGVALSDGSDGPGNAAPEISGPAAASVNEGGTQAFQISASDANSDPLTYTLSGADASAFEINATTGAVSFTAAPDFEAPTDAGADNVYNVTVTASDGTLTDTQNVAITVENVNEAPVLTAEAAVSVSESETAVLTVAATDVDGDVVTYSLSGTDAALFVVDTAGVVTFVDAADFEAPGDADGDNVYDITVTATDGTLTDSQDIAITVTDQNDESPVFTSGAGGFVTENTASPQAVYLAEASDADSADLTYALSGADADLFNINAVTGAVTFAASANFEVPTDAGADNVYNIVVTASDGLNSTDQAVTLTVTDVNEAPVITADSAVSAAENQTTVLTVASSDPDGDALTYSLSGADAALFAIDSSGVVTFSDARDFETPSDADRDNVYDLSVTASDGELFNSRDVAITVTNENEAPVLEADSAVSVAENQTAVLTAVSSDVDGDTLTYSLSGADAALFAVDPAGVVTFIDAPDFEGAGDTVYNITVTASDGTLSDSQDIVVTLTDENEAPVLVANAAVSVSENQTAVMMVTSSDVDGDALTYSLSGDDAALFTIDASGVVAFADAPNFEAPADANDDNIYDVSVTASDGTLTDSQDLTITVTNENEAPILSASSSVSVLENQTAVLTAIASDVDGDTLTYSLSGADAELFAIDASGILTFANAPDFEAPADAGGLDNDNGYSVTVTASDGVLSDSQNVTVTVTDANEAPSLFADAAVTVTENETAVLTATASDVDGDMLTYSLSGDDAALFAIDTAGALTFIDAPDFETPADVDGDNVYDVIVTASDGALTDSQNIAITVTDENEAPVFTSASQVSVDEGDFEPYIATATADVGETLTYAIVGGADYLTPSDRFYNTDFTIDPNSGAISYVNFAPRFRDPDDVNSDSIYELQISVTDGAFTTLQDIEINVLDVDAAPIFAIERVLFENNFIELQPVDGRSAFSTTFREGQPIASFLVADEYFDGQVITSFEMAGPDAGAFTFTEEFNAGQFVISVLAFDGETDFEMPADANGDNVYELTFTTSDGVNTSYLDLTITIEDVIETVLAPVFVSSAAFNVDEGLAFIGSVLATDDDGPFVEYAITGGTNANLFTIDTVTGSLSFADETLQRFDLNQPAYQVEVTANDGLNETIQTISVTVDDANVAPVINITGGTTFTVVENADDVYIGGVGGTDRFDNDVLTMTFSGADIALFDQSVFDGAIWQGQAFGGLVFTNAPDFETPLDADGDNIYEFTLTLSDGVNTVSQDYTVEVTDIIETIAAPVFVTGTALSVDEGNLFVANIEATDADGPFVEYSMSGVDAQRFELDSMSGALNFVFLPSTGAPVDFDRDNVFEIDVTATDGFNNTTTSISITLEDINAAPLFFADIPDQISIEENSLSSFFVEGGDRIDGDIVLASVGGADGELFTLVNSSNPGSEVFAPISFNNRPDFETPLDADGDNVYEIDIILSDGVNETIQSVSITVTDIFESPNAPVFTSPASFSFAENARFVGNLVAEDADLEAVTYSIVSGDFGFFVDFSTGSISRFNFNTLDFENPEDANGDNVYNLVVAANDGTGNITLQDVEIIVTDVDDVAPSLSSARRLNFDENMPISFTPQFTDSDSSSESLSVTIIGDGFGFFELNPLTFEITAPAPDAELEGSNTSNSYNLQLLASDGVNETIETLFIQINDLNDTAPTFRDLRDITLVEGQVFARIPVQIEDRDLLVSENEVRPFISVSGIDAAQFNVDSNSVSFNIPPDFENPRDSNGDNVYEIELTVSDGELSTTEALIISISDQNFEFGAITLNLPSQLNLLEGQFEVFGIENVDASPTVRSEFAIIGGEDANLFQIGETTGLLEFITAPTFSDPQDLGNDGTYEVQVISYFGGVSEIVTTLITVTEAVGNIPVITSPATVSLNEAETSVFTVIASDLDGDTLTYSIIAGADSDLFEIDNSTGAVSTASPDGLFYDDLTFPVDIVYNVRIGVDDGNNNVSQTFAIELVNLDLPPILTLSVDNVNLAENTSAFSFIDLFFASTQDRDSFNLTQSIEGVDAAFFTDNGIGGLLARQAFDFEAPQDADGDNVYELEYVVSDGTTEVREAFTVTVTDVYESPNAPVITSPNTFTINEGQADVGTIVATDLDGDVLTYSVGTFGALDNREFRISPEGELTFRDLPNIYFGDRSRDGDLFYEVEITVSDGFNDVVQIIDVELVDINVAPVFLGSDPIIRSVAEETSGFNNFFEDVFFEDFDSDNVTVSLRGADADDFNLSVFGSSGIVDGFFAFTLSPDFENPTDANGDNIYEFELVASDGINETVETVEITVTDVFENAAPVFTGPTTFSVNEGELEVATITATDSDGDNLEFILRENLGLSGNDGRFFEITADGQLSFKEGLAYNDTNLSYDGDFIYTVGVTVFDGIDPVRQLFSVELIEANQAPFFTSFSGVELTGTRSDFTIPEAAFAAGVEVAGIYAADYDLDDTLTSSLRGPDAGLFTPESSGHEFAFLTDFVLISTPIPGVPGDADGDNIYEFEIVLSDGEAEIVREISIALTDITPMSSGPLLSGLNSFEDAQKNQLPEIEEIAQQPEFAIADNFVELLSTAPVAFELVESDVVDLNVMSEAGADVADMIAVIQFEVPAEIIPAAPVQTDLPGDMDMQMAADMLYMQDGGAFADS